MSFPFKLIVPGAVALYLAAACTPDLNSLCADTQCDSAQFVSRNSSGGDTGAGGEDGLSGSSNGGGPVVAGVCENNKKESNESDVDCGGTSKCDRCTTNLKCTQNRDCASDYCKNSRCTEPTCTDKIVNQGETGQDCGGPCLPCDFGVACSTNMDCSGEYCADNKCGDHCVSKTREADETDVDCGGESCSACDTGKHCNTATDCKSLICSNNACQAPTCNDNVKNQDESDKDCGGACVASNKACQINSKCNTEADCASWVCAKTAGVLKCAADTVTVAADAVIDDFEDGNFTPPALGTPPRAGNWYPFSDGSGTINYDIATINRGASLKSIHFTGKDFTGWGSGIGVDLAHGSGDKLTWDASAYTGITFWARANVAGTNTLQMTIAFPDIDTDGLVKNRNCTTCDHHYLNTQTLTSGWQRFNIAFADLQTPESGTVPAPTMFKPGALASVQFRFNGGTTYDVYIDDLAFVK